MLSFLKAWMLFMLSCLGCHHLCYHFMLSFFTVSKCSHFYVIIFACTYFVLSFMLSFDVIIYCYHFLPFFFFLKTWHTQYSLVYGYTGGVIACDQKYHRRRHNNIFIQLHRHLSRRLAIGKSHQSTIFKGTVWPDVRVAPLDRSWLGHQSVFVSIYFTFEFLSSRSSKPLNTKILLNPYSSWEDALYVSIFYFNFECLNLSSKSSKLLDTKILLNS